jgi:hypothetical protein
MVPRKKGCCAGKYGKCPNRLAFENNVRVAPVINEDVVINDNKFVADREPCGRSYNADGL